MGWDVEQLMGLFHDPAYPVLNQLRAHYGDQAVRERVEGLVGGLRGFRVKEVIADDPEPEGDEPELIQISIRCAGADRHDQP